MSIKSPMLKKCHVCKNKAKMYDEGKYWCGIGFYDRHGKCKVNNGNKKTSN